MSKFILIQTLIKLFLVAQNLWYTQILNIDNVSNLFLVLSSVIALNIILDFNSSIEINRETSDEKKIILVKAYMITKGSIGIFAAFLLFVYFKIILNIDTMTALVSFTLPFDAIISLMMTKFLSLHELKLYHYYTILVSSLKVLFPVLTFFFLNSVSFGLILASIIPCIFVLRDINLRDNLRIKIPWEIMISSFGVGLLLNLTQKIDVFLISHSEFPWRQSFYVYNRFYEFALFPLSLLVGYKLRHLEKSSIVNNYTQISQIFVVGLILISTYLISTHLNDWMVLLFGFKYSFVVLGMFLFPVYSKNELYSRNKLVIGLLIVLLTRFIVGSIFDIGVYIVLWTEFALLACLAIVTVPAINKNRAVNV